MNKRIAIHVCSKDRPAELGFLMTSLLGQTIQNWDLMIVDDASVTPITNSGFLGKIFTRLKLEGHKIKIARRNTSLGVCTARNMAIESDTFNNMYTARLDDDSILKPDCLELLLKGITEHGFDLVGGVIPRAEYPDMIRETKFAKPIINKHTMDSLGNLNSNKDECGYCYDTTAYIPTHQFRTYCLYKSKMHKDVKYPIFLSPIGFREEGFFSMKAIIAGYKLGICTGAIAWHLVTEVGGCRDPNYNMHVQADDLLFRDWLKEQFEKHGDFLKCK